MSLASFHGTYDPAEVVLTIADQIIAGYADGEFILVKYDEDRFFKRTGVDGEVSRIRNASSAGSVEVTLLGTANDNATLAKIVLAKDPFSIGITDLSGTTQMLATRCWLKKHPDLSMAKEISNRVWTFDCADIQMEIGGSNNNSLLGLVAGLF